MQGISPVDPDAPTWPDHLSPSPSPPSSPALSRRDAQPPPVSRSASFPHAGGLVSPRTRTNGVQPFPPRILLGLSRLVAMAVGIVEVALLLRIALLLLSANPAAGFSSWIYGLTAPLVTPFAGVFPTLSMVGGVLDAPAILALIVYALAGRIVESLLHLLARL